MTDELPPNGKHLQLLSDEELNAAEETIRAAIRWTDTGPKVMSIFDLLMAELRRLRS